MMMFLLLKHTTLLEEGVFLWKKSQNYCPKKKRKTDQNPKHIKKKKKETRGHIIHQNVSFFVFLLHKILLETRERL